MLLREFPGYYYLWKGKEGSGIGQKEKSTSEARPLDSRGQSLFGWGNQTFYTPTLISHWILDTHRRNTDLSQVGFLQLMHSLKGLKIDFPRAHIFSCKADNRNKSPITESPCHIPKAIAVQVKKERGPLSVCYRHCIKKKQSGSG